MQRSHFSSFFLLQAIICTQIVESFHATYPVLASSRPRSTNVAFESIPSPRPVSKKLKNNLPAYFRFKRQNLLCKMAMTVDSLAEKNPSTSSKTVTSNPEDEVPKTMPEAFRVFFFSKHGIGPLIVAITLCNLLVWRLVSLGPVTAMDFFLGVGMIVFWVFQEHFLHGKVLHSKMDWYGKTIHQEHHDKPYFQISIDPPSLMLVWMATAHAIFRCLLPLPLAITATLGYATAGLFYEWSHYIVHTKVKPGSQFMKKMRDNHIRHHCVDEKYWLAFSLPAVDDFFGTNPDVREVKRRKKEARQKAAS